MNRISAICLGVLLSGCTSQNDALTEDVRQLHIKLDTADSHIAILRGKVADLESQVATLETQGRVEKYRPATQITPAKDYVMWSRRSVVAQAPNHSLMKPAKPIPIGSWPSRDECLKEAAATIKRNGGDTQTLTAVDAEPTYGNLMSTSLTCLPEGTSQG